MKSNYRSPEAAVIVAARAQRLRDWLERTGTSQMQLVRLSGLPQSVVTGAVALSGQYRDLATMLPHNVAGIVRGMQAVEPDLTGEEIAEMLDIPESARGPWIEAGRKETIQHHTGRVVEIPLRAAVEGSVRLSGDCAWRIYTVDDRRGLHPVLWLWRGQDYWTFPAGVEQSGPDWERIGAITMMQPL